MKRILTAISVLLVLGACGDKKKKEDEKELTPIAFYAGDWNMSTNFKLYMDNELSYELQEAGSIQFEGDSVLVCPSADSASCRKAEWRIVYQKMFINFGDGDGYIFDVNKMNQNREQWIYTVEDTFSNPVAKTIWTWDITR